MGKACYVSAWKWAQIRPIPTLTSIPKCLYHSDVVKSHATRCVRNCVQEEYSATTPPLLGTTRPVHANAAGADAERTRLVAGSVGGAPTMADLPHKAGSSRCSTEAKSASMSTWAITRCTGKQNGIFLTTYQGTDSRTGQVHRCTSRDGRPVPAPASLSASLYRPFCPDMMATARSIGTPDATPSAVKSLALLFSPRQSAQVEKKLSYP